MRSLLVIFVMIPISISPQSATFDFHSPQNIKLFADYLFCDKDYLRAIEQYEMLQKTFNNDTVEFKIMLSYSNLGLYNKSNELLARFNSNSKIFPDSYLLSLKNKLINEQNKIIEPAISSFDSAQWKSYNRISSVSMLYENVPTISKVKYISVFDKDEQSTVSFLFDYKFDPPYKSSALAGVMSAVIPGSGKMYVGDWGDGISGLLITGLFAFLAYDNFKANHTTKAWVFTGIGAFFYAGNIYGSIAAAQIFNAKIDFEFQNGLKIFLEKENYFLPEYDFCN